ncbi:MAG: hypothetical protein HKN30_09385 [Sulfitobacter sp.]|nr:hypothetical protein [Sulfitobacter sp.]
MKSTRHIRRFFGLLAPFSLVATPLHAITPPAEQAFAPAASPAVVVDLDHLRLAQVGGSPIGNQYSDTMEPGEGPSDDGPSVVASDPETASIVQQIEQIKDICMATSSEYQIDCFATLYSELAKDIPATGDYADAKEIIEDAARDLRSLSSQNRDRSKPAVRATLTTETGATVTTPPITAVRPETVPSLKLEAANILEEAETKLLRSASSDAKRAIHYQRIAAAVGSNKVLLRSA